MERPIIADMNELTERCKQVVEQLEEIGNPYIEVHISMDGIKVTSMECNIPLKKAINQKD